MGRMLKKYQQIQVNGVILSIISLNPIIFYKIEKLTRKGKRLPYVPKYRSLFPETRPILACHRSC